MIRSSRSYNEVGSGHPAQAQIGTIYDRKVPWREARSIISRFSPSFSQPGTHFLPSNPRRLFLLDVRRRVPVKSADGSPGNGSPKRLEW